jgi:hypothetical protein
MNEDPADIDHVGENKYRKMRRQRERERRLQELKKWEFPKRIGSYNEFIQPALEFTKQICNNVFGLDQAF